MPKNTTAPLDTTLPTEQLADLLLCAFRYALGRRTYITSTVSALVRVHWMALPVAWQELVQREIREAIEGECAGDACDISSWRALLTLPIQAQ